MLSDTGRYTPEQMAALRNIGQRTVQPKGSLPRATTNAVWLSSGCTLVGAQMRF